LILRDRCPELLGGSSHQCDDDVGGTSMEMGGVESPSE
jgi:hypothetical protein